LERLRKRSACSWPVFVKSQTATIMAAATSLSGNRTYSFTSLGNEPASLVESNLGSRLGLFRRWNQFQRPDQSMEIEIFDALARKMHVARRIIRPIRPSLSGKRIMQAA
jgi:hypothetical protein